MLNFPNASRSFDESKNRICFWGYDKTFEIAFFVGVDVLKKINNKVGSAEAELLSTFDGALSQIYKVATKTYKKGGSGQGRFKVILTANDF